MKIIVKEEKNLIDYLVSNTDYTKTKIKSLLKEYLKWELEILKMLKKLLITVN